MVAVLGGGNGAHAAVVDLQLKGYRVAWWRRDAGAFPPDGCLRYTGILGEGEITVERCTDVLAEAVEDADLVVAPLPADAQPPLLDRLAPALRDGQAVAFTPGTFGSWLGAQRRPGVTFLETGTLPYLARVTAPGEVSIPVVATRLPTGSIPGEGPAADAAHEAFAAAYPSAVRVSDGWDAALCNWGPVLHPPLIVQNLGAIESLGDAFDIHAAGTSEGVVRTILAVDEERIALRRTLNLPGEHWPIRTHYDESPQGMYGSDAKRRLVESGLWRERLHPRHRYVTEDLLCGLVLTASWGRAAGQPMPVSEALLTLAAPSLGVDPWTEGRSAASIGAEDLEVLRAAARHGGGR
ncbi:NAD/NADP octopine/nopaline dehydrogenase family protein [Egibacter rhizosphaerae]|uniref:NAD/NADP octopine/nopaline dehydrogenase family protein n=1 Tax=Egibacter rhizosphaerae TaxID=1670831 RepID=UPI001F115E12|nr:NAD/NADP octopine/nopaline dehydrogenase family protein [Egibacter rhizosphaerae]